MRKIRSADISIMQDGRIFVIGAYVGFIDDETVYMVGSSGHAIEAGKIDHRAEAVGLVLEWFNNGSSSSPV